MQLSRWAHGHPKFFERHHNTTRLIKLASVSRLSWASSSSDSLKHSVLTLTSMGTTQPPSLQMLLLLLGQLAGRHHRSPRILVGGAQRRRRSTIPWSGITYGQTTSVTHDRSHSRCFQQQLLARALLALPLRTTLVLLLDETVVPIYRLKRQQQQRRRCRLKLVADRSIRGWPNLQPRSQPVPSRFSRGGAIC